MKVVLKNLTKKFPNRNKKIGGIITAVGNLSLEIPDGKLVGLLGPSGCGKSTTLNMISGIETPTEGQIFFGDNDVTKLAPEKRGIGLVFQNYALYPHLTVRQNVRFPLENLRGKDKMKKDEMNAKVDEALRLVKLTGYEERKPAELSGGQQQRVAIARALVKMPRVLLLDEPLSNLDARLRLQTREEIRRIQQNTGITTIFVTHDQEEAMSISDFIVVMKNGVVQQVGAPQDVYDNPANLFVAKFLGTPPINVFSAQIKEGNKIYIGDDFVATCENKFDADKNVFVAIRPEGFVIDDNGALKCSLSRIEVLGRDTSIVATHPAMSGENIRSIVPSESALKAVNKTEINFTIKPNKFFVFDCDTEEKLDTGAITGRNN